MHVVCVCTWWLPSGGSSLDGERNSRTPLKTSIDVVIPQWYLIQPLLTLLVSQLNVCLLGYLEPRFAGPKNWTRTFCSHTSRVPRIALTSQQFSWNIPPKSLLSLHSEGHSKPFYPQTSTPSSGRPPPTGSAPDPMLCLCAPAWIWQPRFAAPGTWTSWQRLPSRQPLRAGTPLPAGTSLLGQVACAKLWAFSLLLNLRLASFSVSLASVYCQFSVGLASLSVVQCQCIVDFAHLLRWEGKIYQCILFSRPNICFAHLLRWEVEICQCIWFSHPNIWLKKPRASSWCTKGRGKGQGVPAWEGVLARGFLRL